MMIECSNASEAILSYYLPMQNSFMACPLDDPEFKQIGEAMRGNEAMLVAAEESGLMAEAMAAYFNLALENFDSWYAMREDLAYVLDNPRLCRYVRFEHQYMTRRLLEAGQVIDDSEDLWDTFSDKISRKLRNRKLRGFAWG